VIEATVVSIVDSPFLVAIKVATNIGSGAGATLTGMEERRQNGACHRTCRSASSLRVPQVERQSSRSTPSHQLSPQ